MKWVVGWVSLLALLINGHSLSARSWIDLPLKSASEKGSPSKSTGKKWFRSLSRETLVSPLCENRVCEQGETVSNCPWDCQPEEATVPFEKPNFCILTSESDQPDHYYEKVYSQDIEQTSQFPEMVTPASEENPSQWTFADDLVDATISYLGRGEWELRLRPHVDIRSVSFPCRLTPSPINGAFEDDVIYYPYLGGVFRKEGVYECSHPDCWWYGVHPSLTYPGGLFAPILINADLRKGRIIAATNWPPKATKVFFGRQVSRLVYPEPLPAETDATYRIILADVTGSPSSGYPPWQLALQRYKDWLDRVSPTPSYPEWLRQSEGFLSIQLQNYPCFNMEEIRSRSLLPAGDYFPLVLFWGQMSNYAGDPANQLRCSEQQRPAEERADCCLYNTAMHPRYLPHLLDFAHELSAQGVHTGYYANESPAQCSSWCPYDPPENPNAISTSVCPFDCPEGRNYLREWNQQNQDEYGATAFYNDVIGRKYAGRPASVLELFSDGTIPPETVIEGFVDIYPRCGLMSGYLRGGDWGGGPGVSPEMSERGTFIQLSRYLMGNRCGFLGMGNGDHLFYGEVEEANRRQPLQNPHWLERQIFLLGLKSDIWDPTGNYWTRQPFRLNPYLETIRNLRRRVNWWARSPQYLDTAGLSSIPVGIDARRFRTQDGKNLIAVDNPGGLSGEKLRFRGQSIPIPADPLSLHEVN